MPYVYAGIPVRAAGEPSGFERPYISLELNTPTLDELPADGIVVQVADKPSKQKSDDARDDEDRPAISHVEQRETAGQADEAEYNADHPR